jgi:hypothetical protein
MAEQPHSESIGESGRHGTTSDESNLSARKPAAINLPNLFSVSKHFTAALLPVRSRYTDNIQATVY